MTALTVYVLVRDVDLGYHIEKISLNKEAIDRECHERNQADLRSRAEQYLSKNPNITMEEAMIKARRDFGGDRYGVEVHEILD